MASHRQWVRAATAASGVLAALLVVQYLLGLWTNLHGPSAFTSSSSSPSLDWHYTVGDLVFFLALIVVIFVALARNWRHLPPSIVTLLAVLGAGIFGGLFVGGTPNNPDYSFWMGVLFLVAFGANMSLLFSLRFRRDMDAPHEYQPGAGAPSS